ncbi:PREDICTED: F-box protein At1g78280-like [Branchiostoma belcheri]|uniref:F-box protein At1g78280-like n=1 Tax=Branchiostoma belcheri TaxID=7741 RepID=A0A6P4ZEF4_BRABE|nr:PREDICTED: F-box protein At1g78280-like [Branchiostoma belcheri]
MVRKRKKLVGKNNQPTVSKRTGVTWEDEVGKKSRSSDETDDLQDSGTPRSEPMQLSPERDLKDSGESEDVLQDPKTGLAVQEIRRPSEELHKNNCRQGDTLQSESDRSQSLNSTARVCEGVIRRCDFDVRYADQMTSEEFESTYRNRKPVLLRFRGGARDWTDPDVWTRDGLVSRHGDRRVRTGYPPDIVSNYGIGDDSETLDAYLTRYLDDEDGFDSKYLADRTLMTELLPHIRLPSYLNQSRLEGPAFRLFLGRSGPGLSWHAHGQAWNGVVFGAKRWFMSAPDRPPLGGISFKQLDRMKYVQPYVSAAWRALECLQQAGDVVYIPESFHHAVVNIGHTVAMSFIDEWRTEK